MVVTISTLYIACFVPFSLIVLAIDFKPELSLHGKIRAPIHMNEWGYVYPYKCELTCKNFYLQLHDFKIQVNIQQTCVISKCGR